MTEQEEHNVLASAPPISTTKGSRKKCAGMTADIPQPHFQRDKRKKRRKCGRCGLYDTGHNAATCERAQQQLKNGVVKRPMWRPTLKQGWLPGSLRVVNTEALTHNTSHTRPKISVITWILVLHQSTKILKCSKFKHSGSDTKDDNRRYMGPHRDLRCEVLHSSSELRLPADFSILWWVAIGPHKLATTPTILRHSCNQKDPQERLEQLKLSNTDPLTWS
jgi:hypothetical protein